MRRLVRRPRLLATELASSPPILAGLGWICLPGGVLLADWTEGRSFALVTVFGALVVATGVVWLLNVGEAWERRNRWRHDASPLALLAVGLTRDSSLELRQVAGALAMLVGCAFALLGVFGTLDRLP